MRYYPRVIDKKIDRLTEAFNAVSIVEPKGCGKTRTAKERSKTVIEFQDEEKRDGYLSIAETAPGLFLKNEKPILFDEWQDAPKIWGMIRKACDDLKPRLLCFDSGKQSLITIRKHWQIRNIPSPYTVNLQH